VKGNFIVAIHNQCQNLWHFAIMVGNKNYVHGDLKN